MNPKKRHDNCREYALRLLKIRLRAKNELLERLERKGYANEEISETLKELEDAGFINDERFATLFAADQLEFHVKGPYYVRYKLKMLGVEDFIVEKALEEVFKEDEVKKVLERYVRGHCYQEREVIFKALVRRGFNMNAVRETLLAIYKDWRCEEDESGNNDNSDICSNSDPRGDIGLPSWKDKGAERTKKGKGKRR